MCGSGAMTGSTSIAAVRRPTRRGRPQALTASFVVVLGPTARLSAGSRIVATTAPATATTTATTGCASLSFLRIDGGLKSSNGLKSQRSIVNGQWGVSR